MLKNAKFQNTLKYDLNEFWYRFRVQNASKTPQASISCHITSFWAILANVWKIEFSSKYAFFMILGVWLPLTIWPIMGPEVSKNVFGGRKRPLGTFKRISHTVDNDFWWLEQILKNHEKSSFLSIFLLWAQRRKIDENDDFSVFFMIF